MVEILIKSKKPCWFFHRWKVNQITRKDDRDPLSYIECEKCKSRKVYVTENNINDVNWNWLEEYKDDGTNTIK